MKTLLITKQNLRQAMLNWQNLVAQGDAKSDAEVAEMSSEAVATESADYLFEELEKITS